VTYQISGRDWKGREFTAGIHCVLGHVHRAAPILGFMRGWPTSKMREHCQERGWRLVTVERNPDVER